MMMFVQTRFVDYVKATGSSGYRGGVVYPTGIKIQRDFSVVNTLGQKYQLNIEFSPKTKKKKKITWTSGDNSILTIDENGVLVAKKRGTVQVTAKSVNGKIATTTITVNASNNTSGSLKSIKNISITNNPKKMLTGEQFTINVQTSPVYDTSKIFTYKSSNKKVLTVDKNGVVKAVGKGKASITVTSNNNKKATITIQVEDYRIKLSDKVIKGDEGYSKEITATIETKLNINPNNVKWSVSSPMNVSVKSAGNDGKTFKANVYLKKSGNTNVKVKIGNESAAATVKINKVGSDTSIECPNISYDTSNSGGIKIVVYPSSKTDYYDVSLSANKRSGYNARWYLIESNLVGNRTFYYPYTSAQARLTVYDKNGKSRYCYTAPFDLDRSKGSNTNVTYSYWNICPSIVETKLDVVSGANVYKIHGYGSDDIVKTGVKTAHIKINANASRPYQYSWYVKEGKYYISNICDDNGCGSWNLFNTFDQYKTKDFTLTPSSETYYDKQGMVLLMDKFGSIQTCYTGIYNSIAYNKKSTTKYTNTNVYFEKDYSYNVNTMFGIVDSLPPAYVASSNVYFLSEATYLKLVGPNSCGIARHGQLDTYLKDGSQCPYDYAQWTIIHELGHIIDSMYYKLNKTSYISSKSDMIDMKNRYIGTQYLRDYSYSGEGNENSEFWADLFSMNYVNYL